MQKVTDGQQANQSNQPGADGAGTVVVNTEVTLNQQAPVEKNNDQQQKRQSEQRSQQSGNAPRTVMGADVVETTDAVVSDSQLVEVVRLLEKTGDSTRPAIYQLIEYCASMDPKKRQTETSIETNQLKLLNALYVLMSTPASEFRYAYAAVLALVRRHRHGCFGPTYRNRGLNSVSIGTIDNKNMRFLTRVVDLLALTVDTPNVDLLKKHYDIKKLMESVPSVVIRQNLTAYYSA